jgi:hypothetical protein
MGENAATWGLNSLCGVLSGRCIKVVGTRTALGTSGQVARVRTVLLIVRPEVAASVRTQAGPVQMIGLHSRPNSNRVSSEPLIRPDAKRDRPDAPH